MKLVKGIGLFFVYPIFLIGIGFVGGIYCMNFFYPGYMENQNITTKQINEISDLSLAEDMHNYVETSEQEETENEVVQEAIAIIEKITADTDYVLEETDVIKNSIVETTWQIPERYIGMDREQFIQAMEEYESNPPLSELERGFVSLEVMIFSAEKVVVQMNYEYMQPSNSFYVTVQNNFVVVYLEDMESIYMYTDILLSDLPDEVQQEVIEVMYVEDEEQLYNFLESYSS